MKFVLSLWWGYCSGAALFSLSDNHSSFSLLNASLEERFVREKNTSIFPMNSIDWVLRINNINPQDLDQVVFASMDVGVEYILLNKHKWSVADYIKENNEYWLPIIYESASPNLLDIFRDKLTLEQYPGISIWQDLGIDPHAPYKSDLSKIQTSFNRRMPELIADYLSIDKNKIIKIDHHTSHSYFAHSVISPSCKDVLVFTNDGWGDGRNATVSHFSVDENDVVQNREIYSSSCSILARVYRYMTLLLGMKPSEHEFKVMGLSAYGKDNFSSRTKAVFNEAMSVEDGDFKVNPNVLDSYKWFQDRLEGERFDNIAYGLQSWLETSLLDWVEYYVKETGISHIAFAGGLAMNVKAMGILNNQSWIDSVSVPPSSGDETHVFGAFYAYFAQNKKLMNDVHSKFKTTYLGYYSSQEDQKKVIDEARICRFQVVESPSPHEVAQLLARGAILSICRGPAEFGARALGNRSIMIDPINVHAKEKLNLSIKNRDFWMPFAPVILDEMADQYLLNAKKSPSPYMALSFSTTRRGFNDLLSAVHPGDMTTRAQVLEKHFNPYLYKILASFMSLTNRGGLLNTSFNVHGSPIVNTVFEAFEIFKTTSIDALLLDEFLLIKNKEDHL